ncbi:MAG: transporter [Pikeienuella sp.]
MKPLKMSNVLWPTKATPLTAPKNVLWPAKAVTAVSAGVLMAAALAFGPANAQQWEGSLGENGFDNYSPPITNPVLNETPLITTEIRPIYFHQEIPNEFLSGGGDIDVGAMQVRIALTERLGFIATTDGYADIDFDAVLADSSGFADIAAGFKYAAYYNPKEGEILTVGVRYTAPLGNLDVGTIDLTGFGAGSVNVFATGLKEFGEWTVQGSAGVQQAVSNDRTSYFHGSAAVSYNAGAGFFPTLETNLTLPYDGGDRIANSSLTGIDIADFGSSDPENVWTVGAGMRYAATENALIGAAFEYNLSESANDIFEWRALFDLVIHF